MKYIHLFPRDGDLIAKLLIISDNPSLFMIKIPFALPIFTLFSKSAGMPQKKGNYGQLDPRASETA